MSEFAKELTSLLNRHGMDQACGVPDFILADHVNHMLTVLSGTVEQLDAWYDRTTSAEDVRVQRPTTAAAVQQ